MPVLTLEDSEYAGPIDDGSIFEAQCVAVKEVTEKFVDKETGKPVNKLEFKFLITDEGPWEGTHVWGKTSLTFNTHPNCKLHAWAQEMLGAELPVDYTLDTDVLQGLFCRVVVGAREYEKNGESKTSNYVTDVLRSRNTPDKTDF